MICMQSAWQVNKHMLTHITKKEALRWLPLSEEPLRLVPSPPNKQGSSKRRVAYWHCRVHLSCGHDIGPPFHLIIIVFCACMEKATRVLLAYPRAAILWTTYLPTLGTFSRISRAFYLYIQHLPTI